MKIRFATLFIALLLYFIPATDAFAQSEYVLPYPGVMPGNRLYKVSQVVDYFQGWWSFGNLSSFTYHLSMADKKLVEAQTLFSYKQYFLGFQALQQSDIHFTKAQDHLTRAENEGKNILEKRGVLRNASVVHIKTLAMMERNVPETFVWRPEKEEAVTLQLKALIQEAVDQRKQGL